MHFIYHFGFEISDCSRQPEKIIGLIKQILGCKEIISEHVQKNFELPGKLLGLPENILSQPGTVFNSRTYFLYMQQNIFFRTKILVWL